jgi:hypothetical protein
VFASSLPRVDDERERPLLKDRRVQGLIAVAVLAGFLAGLLIFGSPWHLPPNWGDIPTWLLVVLAAAASWVGFAQLGALRQQIAEDALRNITRDKLMDKQLEEAERRQESDRRRLVEDVNMLFNGKTGDVVNNSKRPINDITCKVMSKVDRHVLATPDRCGLASRVPTGPPSGTWVYRFGTKPACRFETLRPEARCGFAFKDLRPEPDQVLVAWFTDDAGFRWQLDQYLHLVRSDDESEYHP